MTAGVSMLALYHRHGSEGWEAPSWSAATRIATNAETHRVYELAEVPPVIKPGPSDDGERTGPCSDRR